jgi:hypothetical protein
VKQFDVCVYGGTAGGVVAATTAAAEGLAVVLIEPGRHLGGMSSGGLGATDFGNTHVIGGLSREFYRRMGAAYGKAESWVFEPHAAELSFRDFVAESGMHVLFHCRVVGACKSGGHITSIQCARVPTDGANAPVSSSAPAADGLTITARVFIDASYEGDLMARAGVSYAVGREPVSKYRERLNGICAQTPYHQFEVPVDPYVRPGDGSSGLLPLIGRGDGGKPGDGDRLVQAYNFRLCLTQRSENRLPFAPPTQYDPSRYELLARYLRAIEATDRPLRLHRLVMAISKMPNGKTDVNNSNAVSTDFIGMSWDYPDADYAQRGRIWHEHLNYTQGLLYYLATSPKVPDVLRAEMNTWGLCRDEFTDTNHWPHQLYVREARRMIGRYVITQADCEHQTEIEDVVGMAAYTMDSHNCQRVVQNGVVRNEGNVEVRPTGPYPISYRAITPQAGECDNLLVPVCLSASHIAYGSIRMEPVFMVLGQSAALAARLAIREGIGVQDVNTAALNDALLDAGQVLEYMPTGDPVGTGNPSWDG